MRVAQLTIRMLAGLVLTGRVAVLLAASPIIDEKETPNHPHVTATLLGFSKHGQMAVLQEQSPASRQNNETLRRLEVFDLTTDKVLVQAESEVDARDPQAGQRFEDLLQRTLAERRIVLIHQGKLGKFPVKIGEETFAVEIGPAQSLPKGSSSRLEDKFESGEGSWEYEIVFTSDRKGSKVIGRMRSVPSSTGLTPVSSPVLLGYVRDPYANRVVVVLQQDMTDAASWTTPLYRFMGARLDKRFIDFKIHRRMRLE